MVEIEALDWQHSLEMPSTEARLCSSSSCSDGCNRERESDIASNHLANCNAPDLEYSNALLCGKEPQLPDDSTSNYFFLRRLEEWMTGYQEKSCR